MSTLFFYSKSADKLPGKGANEVLDPDDAKFSKFSDLAKIKHWRKVLSNFHEGEFKFKDLTYRTAEHAYQAQKITMVNTYLGHKFALESGDAIALGDGEVARKNRKLGMLTDHQIHQWGAMSDGILREIWQAKYSQVPSAQAVLLATKDAQLWHGTRGIPKARMKGMEKVRKGLQKVVDESVKAAGEQTSPTASPRTVFEQAPILEFTKPDVHKDETKQTKKRKQSDVVEIVNEKMEKNSKTNKDQNLYEFDTFLSEWNKTIEKFIPFDKIHNKGNVTKAQKAPESYRAKNSVNDEKICFPLKSSCDW